MNFFRDFIKASLLLLSLWLLGYCACCLAAGRELPPLWVPLWEPAEAPAESPLDETKPREQRDSSTAPELWVRSAL